MRYSYYIHTISTHDIHWISVFKYEGLHHGKHRHQPFQKFAQIFLGLQLKIFKPREFYSIETSWRGAYLFNRTHTDVNSHVCEPECLYSGQCLIHFQCSTVTQCNIYVYKRKYLLRRIPHASNRSLNPFVISNIINKQINWLCLTRVAHDSLSTDKPVALEFLIELEFGNVDF